MIFCDPPHPKSWRDSPYLYFSPDVKRGINEIIDEVLSKSIDPLDQLKLIKSKVKKLMIKAFKSIPKVFNSAMPNLLQIQKCS